MPGLGYNRIFGGVALSITICACNYGVALAQGTPEQQAACTPDVFRLCTNYIPDADRITICLKQRNSLLSKACRDALFEHPAAVQQKKKRSRPG